MDQFRRARTSILVGRDELDLRDRETPISSGELEGDQFSRSLTCTWLEEHDTTRLPGCSNVVVNPPAPSNLHTEPMAVTPEPARPLPETKTVHGVELVLIPGGTFTMGSPPGERSRFDNEGPHHEVTLDSFYLARTEVTNAQYALYLEANPKAPKPELWENERYEHPEQPVVALNWHEVKAYCDWAGFVLPTEAQWEYAARAGTSTAYWYGDEAKDLERFGWYTANTGYEERGAWGARVHAVGSKGTNPFGLFDVTGNMWEWTLDAYGSYDTRPRSSDGLRHKPVGDAVRVVRGGSWNVSAHVARSALRSSLAPGFRFAAIGLRPAQGYSF